MEQDIIITDSAQIPEIPGISGETVETVLLESEPVDYTSLINESTSAICNVILFACLAICGFLVARQIFGGWRS